MTDRGKVVTCTAVHHPMATEVQNPEVQQLIRGYHTTMHDAIGMEVVIDPDDENVFV